MSFRLCVRLRESTCVYVSVGLRGGGEVMKGGYNLTDIRTTFHSRLSYFADSLFAIINNIAACHGTIAIIV